MRTSIPSLLAATVALSFAAACTVKDVDAPAFAGPSVLAYSISLEATPDTLTQDGFSSAQIRIRARDANGQEVNGRPLRAAILVDNAVQDFGTLSTKQPVTGQTIIYTAPPASPNPAAQVAQTISIAVTPIDQLDFRGEVSRVIDIRLVPQGVILPNNPNLVAAFTLTPATPKVLDTVSLDASSTTNGGVACGLACTYEWDFGDGTTGSGRNVTHEFRTVGTLAVKLTVTDGRGAQAIRVQMLTVAPGTPPVVPAFLVSPTAPSVGQDVFFSAENATAVLPRKIVKYEWNFGDGDTGFGVTVTHRYRAVGTYVVLLIVTDDAGTSNRISQNVAVTDGLPTVAATVTGTTVASQPARLVITATAAPGASIVSYRVNWGDGSPEEVSDSSTQTHTYAAGTYTIVITVTDSVGRRKTITLSVTVA